MSHRMTLHITLTLNSETIFGSGFSVPGGEDIAVLQDERGYPYLPGTVLKGLLRESVTNWLCWCGTPSGDILNALFGESGWSGLADERRLQFTPLLLQNEPADPEDCYETRTFTAIEEGRAKEGTLRIASCIRRGLVFRGEAVCAREDLELVVSGLRAIKWLGTLRNRGFGRVSFTAEVGEPELRPTGGEGVQTGWIRYRIHTDSPVAVMDMSKSSGNSARTRGCIPGSAVRGMVVGRLVKKREWFEAHRTALLSEQVCFLDALPVSGSFSDPIPSVRGFYEDKAGTRFESVLSHDISGLKRAGVGSFCAPEGETLHYWNAKTGSRLRIHLSPELPEGEQDKTLMFQTEHLESGQDFVGYIHVENSALAPEIMNTLNGTVWLGADRYEGFGKCTVTGAEYVSAPGWERYGFSQGQRPGTQLYLLVLSPLSMLNDLGEPCGIDRNKLARLLGVDSVELLSSSTAMSEYNAFNRQWGCRTAAARMYEPGSVFKLRCDRAPEPDKLLAVQRRGLGIRRGEGFGQILFLRPELVENITGKRSAMDREPERRMVPAQEEEKLLWVMDNADKVCRNGLSRSQVGTIQEKCSLGRAALEEYLDRDLGAKRESRFEEIRKLINSVLDERFTLAGVETERDRLDLLCMLFDFSRKAGG